MRQNLERPGEDRWLRDGVSLEVSSVRDILGLEASNHGDFDEFTMDLLETVQTKESRE